MRRPTLPIAVSSAFISSKLAYLRPSCPCAPVVPLRARNKLLIRGCRLIAQQRGADPGAALLLGLLGMITPFSLIKTSALLQIAGWNIVRTDLLRCRTIVSRWAAYFWGQIAAFAFPGTDFGFVQFLGSMSFVVSFFAKSSHQGPTGKTGYEE